MWFTVFSMLMHRAPYALPEQFACALERFNWRLIQSVSIALVACLVALIAPGLSAPTAAQSLNWQLYSPSSGEFTVLIPGQVTVKVSKNIGLPLILYQSKVDEITFSVSSTSVDPAPDAYTRYRAAIIGSLNYSDGRDDIRSRAREDASGKGWTGTKVGILVNDKEVRSGLVVRAVGTDIVYALAVEAPRNSEVARKFFDSFVVDVEKAKLAHINDIESASYKIVRTSIYLVIPLALLIWFLIIRARTKPRQ
jgi:hypothetical protein